MSTIPIDSRIDSLSSSHSSHFTRVQHISKIVLHNTLPSTVSIHLYWFNDSLVRVSILGKAHTFISRGVALLNNCNLLTADNILELLEGYVSVESELMEVQEPFAHL